jgi:hypothetical protein
MSKILVLLALMMAGSSLIYYNSITSNPITPAEPNLVPYEICETLIDEEHHKSYNLKQTGDNLQNKLSLVNIVVQEDSENEVTVIISD